MTETIFRASRSRKEIIPAPVTPVSDGEPLPERSSASATGEGAGCEYGTPGRNGRLPRGCEADWLMSWFRPLGDADAPYFLLANAERCYAAGKLSWSLSKIEDGEEMAAGPKGRGVPWLDAGGEPALLLQPESEGPLQSYRQDTGAKYLWVSLFMSNDFRRPFAARVGDRLVVQGQEREQPHGSTHEAELSSVEVWSLAQPLDVADNGQLRPGADEPLLFETLDLLCAAWSGGVVTTEPGRILRHGLDLGPTAVVKGDFRPVAFSLDEQGWIYLITDEGTEEEPGPRALWILDDQNSRRLRYVLPAPLDQANTPPLVSHDHRVTIQGGQRLLTLEANGDVAWCRPIHAEATQAAVTPDDQVLLGEGPELAVFDRTGQRRVLHTFEEALTTTPILTTSDRLLVASAQTLFCMIPEPKL